MNVSSFAFLKKWGWCFGWGLYSFSRRITLPAIILVHFVYFDDFVFFFVFWPSHKNNENMSNSYLFSFVFFIVHLLYFYTNNTHTNTHIFSIKAFFNNSGKKSTEEKLCNLKHSVFPFHCRQPAFYYRKYFLLKYSIAM